MKNLLIAALSAVVMLSGCASSRTFQPKKLQADKPRTKREYIKIQKAAEIARQVLQENEYSITHFEWEEGRYACVRATKSVRARPIKRPPAQKPPFPLFFLFSVDLSDSHNYRTEIKITKKDGRYRYEVSSSWKFRPWFLDLLGDFRPSHRDKKEEKKILDAIEQKYQ